MRIQSALVLQIASNPVGQRPSRGLDRAVSVEQSRSMPYPLHDRKAKPSRYQNRRRKGPDQVAGDENVAKKGLRMLQHLG
jgi:hypothetical protein